MKLSELSARSDVPIASIKFYRREGLLPPGRAVGATTAEYDEDHLRRLKLIRALIRFGGLSVSAVRDVLAALEEPRNPAQVRGVVDYALPTDLPQTDSRTGDDDGSVWAAEVIERMGWDISEMSPHRQALDERMRVLRRLDMDFQVEELLPYARLAESVAELDDAHLDSPGDSVTVAERVAVFSALFGPVLPLLRRLAHENRARRTSSA
ncbi:MerR family transcriptional regulator [Nocardia sp. NPDC051321]|uniref:MerR family transcriptional regulator n=1 Tax=Nocardia sp. NPDC051321 TaxID=3364323 RepID=UPI00378F3DE0